MSDIKEWRYKTPVHWSRLVWLAIGIPYAVVVNEGPLGSLVMLLIGFASVLLLWRRGVRVTPEVVVTWSGPGFPIRSKERPLSDFSHISLKEATEKSKASTQLELESHNLDHDDSAVVLIKGTVFDYDKVLVKAVALAGVSRLPLNLGDELVSYESLSQDIRQRCAGQKRPPRKAPENRYHTVVGDDEKGLVILLPGSWKRVVKSHWILAFLAVLSTGSTLYLWRLVPLGASNYGQVAVPALITGLLYLLLAATARDQELTLTDTTLTVVHKGAGVWTERERLDLANVLMMGLAELTGDHYLNFFSVEGRICFARNVGVPKPELNYIKWLVEERLAQTPVSQASTTTKIGDAWRTQFLIAAWSVAFLVALAHFSPERPAGEVLFNRASISADGTVCLPGGDRAYLWPKDVEIAEHKVGSQGAVQIATDGRSLVFQGSDIVRSELSTGRATTLLTRGKDGPYGTVALNGDGTKFAFRYDGQVYFHDVTTRQVDTGLAPSEIRKGALSEDATQLVYQTRAAEVEGDSNRQVDVFVTNLAQGTRTLVSVGLGQERDCTNARISGDGSAVVFESISLTLHPEHARRDVYLRELSAPAPVCISLGLDGNPANGKSWDASLDRSGRWIAFCSNASNLVEGDTNERTDIFVFDRLEKSMKLISRGTNGTQAEGDSYSPLISADGHYVLFASSAENLVDPRISRSHLFRYEMESGEIRGLRIWDTEDKSSSGSELDRSSDQPVVSKTPEKTDVTPGDR